MSTALIGIGSNLGDRRENVRRAFEQLTPSPGIEVVAKSRLYASKPIGGPHGQGDYVNAAAVLQTSLAPHALLKALQQVEAQLGRERNARWAPRTIDLDLLLFDEEIIEDDELTLPHPRMSFRRFVLEPAAEIAPEMVYPVTASRIDELLARLDRGPHYVAIGGVSREDQSWLASKLASVLESPIVHDRIKNVPAPAGEAAVKSLGQVLHWAALLNHVPWNANPRLRKLSDKLWVNTIEGWLLPPAISNFWYEEWRLWDCLFGDDVKGSPDGPSNYDLLFQGLAHRSQSVASPKLVIWLNPTNRPHCKEDRLMCCLSEMFRNSRCGPLLRLNTDDRDWMLAESIAAIKAMQPLEGGVQ
jgi:2-amino-4-hydroxy-6-hydroxymethyldihydropteridine diphosphokinase